MTVDIYKESLICPETEHGYDSRTARRLILFEIFMLGYRAPNALRIFPTG